MADNEDGSHTDNGICRIFACDSKARYA